MAECAHFHYENVDFGNIQVSFRFLLYRKHHCVWLPANLGRGVGRVTSTKVCLVCCKMFSDKKLKQ